MEINELTRVLTELGCTNFSVWENDENYMGETPPLDYGDFFIDWRSEGKFPSKAAIEAKYNQIKVTLEVAAVQEKRALEYPPKEDLIVALWEKIVEGKEEKSLEVQAKRLEVKQENPLPSAE